MRIEFEQCSREDLIKHILNQRAKINSRRNYNKKIMAEVLAEEAKALKHSR